MKAIIHILLCLLTISILSCQEKDTEPTIVNTPGVCDTATEASLIVPMASADAGGEICIPIRSKNFKDITAFMGAIKWDPNILSYTRLEGKALQGEVANLNNTAQGTINYLWMDSSAANPITVNDGQDLLQVCYKVVGTQGQTSSVAVTALPNFVIEVVNSSGAVIPHCAQEGTFTVK